MKAEFKIGEKRLYKIKELSEFYDRIMNKTYYKYGDKLQFIHTKESIFRRITKITRIHTKICRNNQIRKRKLKQHIPLLWKSTK